MFIAKNLQYVFVEREIQGRINVFEFSQVFSVPEAWTSLQKASARRHSEINPDWAGMAASAKEALHQRITVLKYAIADAVEAVEKGRNLRILDNSYFQLHKYAYSTLYWMFL